MTRSLRFSLTAYRALLRLYPADLRHTFGSEMLEMFEYDLTAARGMKGALHLWSFTLRETLDVLLPQWWDTPEIAVPVLSTAVMIVANSPTLIISIHSQFTTRMDALTGLAMLGLVTALTSFIAVCRWMRSGLTTLRLN